MTSGSVTRCGRAGGRVTAGAMRWHDGTWLRRPSKERIVRALGEPLVVIRRSVLNEVLAGALGERHRANRGYCSER